MNFRFESYMALRYLRGLRTRLNRRRFLRFVTYVAVGGVAVGVAALLLALSITRGFSREIERKIVEFGAHVQVENLQDAPLSNAEALRERLVAYPEVMQVIPLIEELVLMRSRSQIDGLTLRGTDTPLDVLADNLVEGTLTFEADADGHYGVVLSRVQARLLEAEVGQTLTAFSMRSLRHQTGSLAVLLNRPRVKQFYLAGIYDTGLAEFDERFAFTALEPARGLLSYEVDEVSRFDLRLEDIDQAEAFAMTVELDLGFPILARSIYSLYRNLFDWVNLQQGIIPLVVGVIILVAAINIIGILLMTILERTREIGILRSMGASARMVQRVFLFFGLMLGVVGLAIGEAVALALALVQQRYGVIPIPEETYYMSTAPIDLSAMDFVLVALVTLPLCVLASYIPARVAARTDPVRAIRFAT